MRLIISFAAIACFTVPVLAQDGGDPNVRYPAMRNALARAKTLVVDFESELVTEKEKVPVKGKLILAEGNRLRVETTYELGGMTVEVKIVSDGKTTRTTRSGGKTKEKETKANQNANFLAMLERAGFAVPMFTITAAKGKGDPDMTKLLQVSNLKRLGVEDAKLYHLGYQLTIEDKVRFNVETFTDLSTNLPVRRVITVDKGADAVTVRETYRIQRDVDIKGGTFTLEP